MARSKRGEAAASFPDHGTDKTLFASFLVGALVVTFLAGALASTARIFPGPQIARAYEEIGRASCRERV